MPHKVVRVGALGGSPLDEAELFDRMSARRTARHNDLVLVFTPAAHEFRGWRLAFVQDLAREAAPNRVNGIVGSDEDAIARLLEYLESAPGITGQLLAV